jgi:tetratricopeptide (TPR) repeat protein
MSKRNTPFPQGKQPNWRQPASPAPSIVEGQLKNAVAFHQAGQLPQAEALYRQILQVSPKHPDALRLLGVMANQLGKYAMALELIDKAIQSNPRDAASYSSRGNALIALGQFEAAIESFDKAIRIDSRLADAYSN